MTKRSLLVHRIHKIMIVANAHSPDVIGAETFFKMEKKSLCAWDQCIAKC